VQTLLIALGCFGSPDGFDELVNRIIDSYTEPPDDDRIVELTAAAHELVVYPLALLRPTLSARQLDDFLLGQIQALRLLVPDVGTVPPGDELPQWLPTMGSMNPTRCQRIERLLWAGHTWPHCRKYARHLADQLVDGNLDRVLCGREWTDLAGWDLDERLRILAGIHDARGFDPADEMRLLQMYRDVRPHARESRLAFIDKSIALLEELEAMQDQDEP
jgi:hypothetical protein